MRGGVSRIEVLILVVLGITFGGMAVMWIARQRQSGLRLQCTNNLKRLGEAFKGYEEKSAADRAAQTLPPSRLAEGYATWPVFLAPRLSAKNALQQWDLQQSYFAQPQEVREALLVYYFCPAHQRTDGLSRKGDVGNGGSHVPGGLGDYASVAGDGAVADWAGPDGNGALASADVRLRKDDLILEWRSRTSSALFEQLRGQSHTLLVGEKHVPEETVGDAGQGDGAIYNGAMPASFSRLAGPGFPLAESIASPYKTNFGSYHFGICLFLYADNSVRPMSTSMQEEFLGNLARRGK